MVLYRYYYTRGVVKRFVEYVKFNIYTTYFLATNLFKMVPEYVIKAMIILAFILVLEVLGIIVFYIYRKYKSIDKYTDVKYRGNNKEPNTYKEDKKGYKKRCIRTRSKHTTRYTNRHEWSR